MPKNQLEAAMKLLGEEYDCKEVRQVMECLVTKNEGKLKKMTSDPIRMTVPILQKFGENVKDLDKFYNKPEQEYGD